MVPLGRWCPPWLRPLSEGGTGNFKSPGCCSFEKEGSRCLVVANLGMAWSMCDSAAPDSQRWKVLLATFDAYKTMKIAPTFRSRAGGGREGGFALRDGGAVASSQFLKGQGGKDGPGAQDEEGEVNAVNHFRRVGTETIRDEDGRG